ncbi:YdeI/OmpD-associated family protein [Marivirga harenae]|uniref:YdeI/OmpD-associated family protein n=1 Tax=Marivirga harenae TaxID=2010992 RepID=UPI0026E00FF7|nr:YdeI/OmpD-associated family protein [Marivirga harenae]WKV10609.1 YdeI/OmpD-associated family protein [Marivirga harenae]|tara:strand:- start:580561 stop:581136 length:576 start_codon:yes stop_codon:yes gene_type:complete
MKEAEEICPSSREEWRDWLELNHKEKDAVWLVFYKRSTPNFNLSWSESVDESLCFGWIDSTKKTIDDERFIQYFSKRRPKSNWSKVNKDKVKNLIDQGLMKDAGFKSIEVAKENGSWTILDTVERLEIPEDLERELRRKKGAMQYFESLNKSSKKGFLYWVASAKRDNTRNKRISEIVENASVQMKPKQFR